LRGAERKQPKAILERRMIAIRTRGSRTGWPFDGEFKRIAARSAFDPVHLATFSLGVAVETAGATTDNPETDPTRTAQLFATRTIR
jgi:polyisoprenoid-binding protein YceI